MTEEERLDRELEYKMDAQDDRRYANRNAEEVLEDISEAFDAEPLQVLYDKLVGELRDYGLEYSADDIFQNLLDDWTSFKSPYVDTNKMLRKHNSELLKELGELKEYKYMYEELCK